MHPSVTTRSTPSTLVEEVRSKLPTTPRTTTTLPGGAASREAPTCARSGEGVAPQRSIVKEQRARSLRTLLAAGSLFLILLGLFCAIHQGEALAHLLLIRIPARSGAHSHPRIFIHHHNTQHVEPSPAAGVASEGILSPLEGRSMQDPANELPRIPLLGRRVNKGGGSMSCLNGRKGSQLI